MQDTQVAFQWRNWGSRRQETRALKCAPFSFFIVEVERAWKKNAMQWNNCCASWQQKYQNFSTAGFFWLIHQNFISLNFMLVSHEIFFDESVLCPFICCSWGQLHSLVMPPLPFKQYWQVPLKAEIHSSLHTIVYAWILRHCQSTNTISLHGLSRNIPDPCYTLSNDA